MSFATPGALAALAVIPLALAAYLLYDRRRKRVAARFASLHLFDNVVERAPGWRRHVPTAIYLLALAALLVGFARPKATLAVPREEATVMLAIDVSRSMTATDVRPTRLAAARAAAKRFLAQVPEKFRVGVVAFATRAVVAAPATHNRDLVRSALDHLRPGEGTAVGEAVAIALEVGRRVPSAEGLQQVPLAILLLSDGAQTQGAISPEQAAERAAVLGVPVSTVALGTDAGVVERELPGGLRERITVPPDPDTLRAIADTTGGEFFEAANAARLRRVYEELGSRLGHRPEEREVTVAFVGGGMLLLLLGGLVSALWFRRLP